MKKRGQSCRVLRYPFTNSDIKEFVQSYLNCKGVNVSCFKENYPGNDWLESFLKRNPTLSQRNAENIKRSRAEVNEDLINSFFDNIKDRGKAGKMT